MGGEWDDGAAAGPSPTDALREGMSRFGELREYLAYFVAAKADALKVSVRNVLIYAMLGLMGLLAAIGFVVVAVVLLCLGIAHAIGSLAVRLFGGGYWLGDLLFGLIVLGGMAAAVVFGLRRLTKTSRKKLVAKYEDRQHKQRQDFGHDVGERAGEQQRRS